MAETTKRKAGRPKADIDWNRVGEMLEAGATAEGVAATLGIDRTTLYNRCAADNNLDFSTFSQQNKAKGIEQLRTKQFEVAMQGDKTMLIWLGKQRLGQSDKAELTVDPEIARLKSAIEMRAREKNIPFDQELQNYVNHFAPEPVKEKLASELVQ